MKQTIKPIKDQQEADKVFDYLTQTCMKVMGVDKVQAAKRIRRLIDSGDINGLSPDSILFKIRVDKYMETPVP